MSLTTEEITDCNNQDCLERLCNELINLHKKCYNVNNRSWRNKCNVTREQFTIFLMEYLALLIELNEKYGIRVSSYHAKLSQIFRSYNLTRKDKSIQNIKDTLEYLEHLSNPQNYNMEY